MATGFDLHSANGVLTISIHRDFDTGSLHQDWSSAIIQQATGVYTSVKVDLSRTGLLSSTFFAGLVRLHQHFSRAGAAQVILHHPDNRTVRNLSILRLNNLFSITARPA
ncbi:hypothetical protein LBMAG53_07790 [Planctomycetota bacterium]|nr:hypothetical protein LBMAG53_07790 [Planctomycetota bacterium]